MTRIKYNRNPDGSLETDALWAKTQIVYVHIIPAERIARLYNRKEEILKEFSHDNLTTIKKLVKEELKSMGAVFYDDLRGRKLHK